MKWVFFLLLAGNLALAAFVYFRETSSNPDAQLVKLQMNADQIQVVPPRQPPAPAQPAQERPAPGPRQAACVEWGAFGATEVSRAQNALGALGLGERARRIEEAVSASYWAYIPPLKSKSDLDRKTLELKKLGVYEYVPVLEPGPWKYAISLGIFRSEEGARKHLTLLRGKGVRSAVIGEREQRVTQSAFLIREPTEPESEKLFELKSEFPSAELKVVECPQS